MNKPFILMFNKNYFKKNDILICDNTPSKVRVTKVYKYNLWRKILNLCGVKFKLFNCVKVENYE